MYMFLTYSMMFLHMFVGLILIGIILLQRGRGGGLAGAFGGMGGQSAFGTKAGDVFTKITIWLATAWIVLGCVCVLLASNSRSQSSKIRDFAPEVKEAGEEKATGEKSDADKKGDDLVIPPAAKPESKPEGVKATDDATDKSVKPDAAAEPKKPEATEKSAEEKKNAAEEGAPAEAKDAPPEKPAEPAKKPDGEAAAEKTPAETKPE